MFQIFQDFKRFRAELRIQGNKMHVNSAATALRNVTRITNLITKLRNPNLLPEERELMESEYNRRKAQLMIQGIVLPDSVSGIIKLKESLEENN